MSTCKSCHASAATPEGISHDTYCPGRVFPHWVETHLPDSALDPAPEGWEDYERVNAAQADAHMRAEYAAFVSQSVDSPEMSYESWLEWERA